MFCPSLHVGHTSTPKSFSSRSSGRFPYRGLPSHNPLYSHYLGLWFSASNIPASQVSYPVGYRMKRHIQLWAHDSLSLGKLLKIPHCLQNPGALWLFSDHLWVCHRNFLRDHMIYLSSQKVRYPFKLLVVNTWFLKRDLVRFSEHPQTSK